MRAKSDPADQNAAKSTSTLERSAGVPPAVSGASRPRFGEITIRNRSRLPHWEKGTATYFITFRLADSLPKSVLEGIELEKKNISKTAAQMNRPLSSDEQQRLCILWSKRIEDYLDHGAGACHLANPFVAQIVSRALLHFDDRRYRLFSWCIMPNHVHVVGRLFPGVTLASTLHSWKLFTAKEAKSVLDLPGTFWQREYYDHLIRSEAEFERANTYVIDNPAKAGLGNWPWVWRRGQDALATAGETPALHRC